MVFEHFLSMLNIALMHRFRSQLTFKPQIEWRATGNLFEFFCFIYIIRILTASCLAEAISGTCAAASKWRLVLGLEEIASVV